MPPYPRQSPEERPSLQSSFHASRGNDHHSYSSRDTQPPGGAASNGSQQPKQLTQRRWSFVLEDLPGRVTRSFHSVNYGYIVRLSALVAGVAGVGYCIHRALVKSQEGKPLAQRWHWCAPTVAATLIDKKQIEGSNMYYYRFALPHSYDYAGYEPISSVQVHIGKLRGMSGVKRWYTPISHPEERGIIEFAIKDCDPGRMSSRLRRLAIGDQVTLGRWMREFRYDSAVHKEIGMICSTGGASVALQMLSYLDKQPTNRTCVSLLYCHTNPFDIPFRREFQDFSARDNRFEVAFNVMGVGMEAYAEPEKKLGALNLRPGQNLFRGSIDPDTVSRTMPPPSRPAPAGSSSSALYRPSLLVCCPQSMMTFLCGKVSTIGHTTYWQGPAYKYYTGFLSSMGYQRKQVYKFGVSKHFMAIQ